MNVNIMYVIFKRIKMPLNVINQQAHITTYGERTYAYIYTQSCINACAHVTEP